MPITILLLLAVLLFGAGGSNNLDPNTEVCADPDAVGCEEIEDDTDTEEGTEVEVDTEEDGTEGDDTAEVGDNPLGGNNYNIVINNDPLHATFNEDGTLAFGAGFEFFEGTYEITDEFLYIDIYDTEYDESVELELTYDDLTLDVVSGIINSYSLVNNTTGESDESFDAQYSGLPYTLELTGGQ